jgi:hypothetical protein
MISNGGGTDRERADRHSRNSRELLYAGTITETLGMNLLTSADEAHYQPAYVKSTRRGSVFPEISAGSLGVSPSDPAFPTGLQ